VGSQAPPRNESGGAHAAPRFRHVCSRVWKCSLDCIYSLLVSVDRD